MKLKALIAATTLVAMVNTANAASQLEQVVTPADVGPMTAVMKFSGGIVENTCDVIINGTHAIYGGISSTTTAGTPSVPADGSNPAVDYKPGETTIGTNVTAPGVIGENGNYGEIVGIALGFYTPGQAMAWDAKTGPTSNIVVSLVNCPESITAVNWTLTGKSMTADPTLLQTTGKNGIAQKMGVAIMEGSIYVLNRVANDPITLTPDAKDATLSTGSVELTAGYKLIPNTVSLTQAVEDAFAAINFQYTF